MTDIPTCRETEPGLQTDCFFLFDEHMTKKDTDNSTKKKFRPSPLTRWQVRVEEFIEFLTYDIWRIDSKSLSKKTNLYYNSIKTVIMTVRNTMELDLGSRAASLTYRTVLSIVPFLAVLFAIARGFGFENILQSEIFGYFGFSNSSQSAAVGQDTLTTQILQLINNSLVYAKGGSIFAGVGVVLLLYTVFTLFQDIENNFNRIWQIKVGRSIQRRATDYIALILFIPIVIILNYGITLILSSPADYFMFFTDILSPLFARIIKVLPYVLTVLVLTLLYLLMPNTRVKFPNALLAAVIAGAALQVFQFLYLSGQIWITKYNAIYGTFAAIPLLLLWLQLSWYIILIGVELSFSAQNVGKFNFDKETQNISRRYRDFFTLLIMTEIVKSFMDEKPALTNDEISEACSVPIGLTNRIIDDLQEMKMICPTPSEKEPKVMAYVPALDINLITVNYLMKKIDQFGSEDFRVDNKVMFYNEWNALMETRRGFYENNRTVLLKDL